MNYDVKLTNKKRQLVMVFCLLSVFLAGCSPIKQSPADVAFDHEIQGDAYSHQGKYIPALQEYQTAIHLAPNSWPAYFKAGQVLEQQGRMQEAIIGYRKVILINHAVTNPPDKAWWHFRLANALFKAGLYKDAVAEYKITNQIATQDKTHSKRLAWLANQSLKLSSLQEH